MASGQACSSGFKSSHVLVGITEHGCGPVSSYSPSFPRESVVPLFLYLHRGCGSRGPESDIGKAEIDLLHRLYLPFSEKRNQKTVGTATMRRTQKSIVQPIPLTSVPALDFARFHGKSEHMAYQGKQTEKPFRFGQLTGRRMALPEESGTILLYIADYSAGPLPKPRPGENGVRFPYRIPTFRFSRERR